MFCALPRAAPHPDPPHRPSPKATAGTRGGGKKQKGLIPLFSTISGHTLVTFALARVGVGSSRVISRNRRGAEPSYTPWPPLLNSVEWGASVESAHGLPRNYNYRAG